MTKMHKIAGMRITRVEPVVRYGNEAEGNWRPADDLPDLAPPEPTEERLRLSSRQIFSSDAISLTHGSAMEDVFEPRDRPEHQDFLARATVYIMSAIVAVVSLPVGLALFAFNILGGANFRTTAHVVALTGFGTALAASTDGMKLLSIF